MRYNFIPATLGLLLLASISFSGPVGAQTDALGSNGDLFALELGLAGDLFDAPTGAEADSTVMVLDIVDQNGTRERLLVPGSEDEDFEMSASMVFEPHSNSIFVVWASQYHFAHTRIRLVQFSEGQWSDPIDITDDPFTFKTAPMLAVTRESFSTLVDGELVAHDRTILHTLWFEEEWSGDAVLYSPLILVDGELVDQRSIVRLADLADTSVPSGSGPPQRRLMVAPAVGRRERRPQGGRRNPRSS